MVPKALAPHRSSEMRCRNVRQTPVGSAAAQLRICPPDGVVRIGDGGLSRKGFAEMFEMLNLALPDHARISMQAFCTGLPLVWSRGEWGRPRQGIAQTRVAIDQVAPQPLAHRGRVHTMREGRLRHGHSALGDVSNQLDSTDVRESGIPMAVHSAEFLESTGVWRFTVPQISPGGQNQPIGLHS